MKLLFSNVEPNKILPQIGEMIGIMKSTPAFIKKHELWNGFFKQKSIALFSIFIACVFSYTMYNNIHDYFTESPISVEAHADGKKNISETESQFDKSLINAPHLPTELLEDDHDSMFSGSLKFMLLIMLEILIFHFVVKTNNILKNQSETFVFKDFSKVQIRIMKVMLLKWVYGLVLYILISIVLGIAGMTFLRGPVMFIIYGYFIGFAFLDNYMEQYKFSIKQSAECIQSHFGAAVVIGVFASILMLIPIVGPLVIPFLCSIAATRYGHKANMELYSEVA